MVNQKQSISISPLLLLLLLLLLVNLTLTGMPRLCHTCTTHHIVDLALANARKHLHTRLATSDDYLLYISTMALNIMALLNGKWLCISQRKSGGPKIRRKKQKGSDNEWAKDCVWSCKRAFALCSPLCFRFILLARSTCDVLNWLRLWHTGLCLWRYCF